MRIELHAMSGLRPPSGEERAAFAKQVANAKHWHELLPATFVIFAQQEAVLDYAWKGVGMPGFLCHGGEISFDEGALALGTFAKTVRAQSKRRSTRHSVQQAARRELQSAVYGSTPARRVAPSGGSAQEER